MKESTVKLKQARLQATKAVIESALETTKTIGVQALKCPAIALPLGVGLTEVLYKKGYIDGPTRAILTGTTLLTTVAQSVDVADLVKLFAK